MTNNIIQFNDAVGDDTEGEDQRPPAFSDEALALRFADQHANNLRYVAAWNRWLMWDGTLWQFDDTLTVFSLIRQVCRAAAAQCNKQRLALGLASAKTVAAVTSLARSDRRLAATVAQWDVDQWLLNTPAGVIDLRTGKMRACRPDDHMTKITAVAPDSHTPTPVWFEFLDRVCAGDAELIAFIQRIFGYALTGATSEHALFFLHGSGANGKTTLVNVITGIMGDYHTTAAIETFTASKQEHHPTDLAGLRGARLVTSVETEKGRRWAETKIKALTGGDKIAARFMRQDFFEFVPTFKLVIAGNHKPGLHSVDEAIRRRFHLLPFNVTIPVEERDKHLNDRLRAEWPGILAWAISGCVQWQQQGLTAPAVVVSATEEYLQSEDDLLTWVAECCIEAPAERTSSAALFASWKNWAERTGRAGGAGSQKEFSQALEDKGYRKLRMRGGIVFLGLLIGTS